MKLDPKKTALVLIVVKNIFPRIGDVRTTEEVLSALAL